MFYQNLRLAFSKLNRFHILESQHDFQSVNIIERPGGIVAEMVIAGTLGIACDDSGSYPTIITIKK